MRKEWVLVILLIFVLITPLFQLEHFIYPYGIKIAAVGDISCNLFGKKTTNIIANHKPQMVLFLGDLSYNNTSHKCFFDNTKQLENTSKVLVVFGNHDKTNRSTKEIHEHYKIPSKGYYSYHFNNKDNSTGLIIVMNTELPWTEGSDQYNFVNKELANSSGYDYKIIATHRPFISCDCDHQPDPKMNSTYHQLFDKYNVDLVLSGHNHNYQRFAPIDNVTYIVNGLGGAEQYPLTPLTDPNTRYDKKFDNTYGYLDLNLTNGVIDGKFISIANGVKDNFTLLNNDDN